MMTGGEGGHAGKVFPGTRRRTYLSQGTAILCSRSDGRLSDPAVRRRQVHRQASVHRRPLKRRSSIRAGSHRRLTQVPVQERALTRVPALRLCVRHSGTRAQLLSHRLVLVTGRRLDRGCRRSGVVVAIRDVVGGQVDGAVVLCILILSYGCVLRRRDCRVYLSNRHGVRSRDERANTAGSRSA